MMRRRKIDWTKINTFGRKSSSTTSAAPADSQARRAKSATTPPTETDTPDPGPAVDRQVWITRALRAVIIAALVCGPIAVLLWLATSAAPDTAPATVKDEPGPVIDLAAQTEAADFAREFVVAWLEADRETDLQRYVDTESIMLPTAPAYSAHDASPSSITRVGDGPTATYAVTVSADVQLFGSEQPPTRRYFSVPVRISDSAVRAATLPAEVAAPSTDLEVKLGYRYPASAHPIAGSVGDFLSAYLTGDGDVTRYTAPGARIAPITPAPYIAVQTTEILSTKDLVTDGNPTDGTTVQVLASTSQSVTDATSVSGQYALTMTLRAGRWEVAALDPAPAYSATAARISPQPSSIGRAEPTESTAPAPPARTTADSEIPLFVPTP